MRLDLSKQPADNMAFIEADMTIFAVQCSSEHDTEFDSCQGNRDQSEFGRRAHVVPI